jgi:glycosyltransferase involved in cell wall biosynthesis
MTGLALGLAKNGCNVTYVAESMMSQDRANLGWTAPILPGIELTHIVSKTSGMEVLSNAPKDAIHICEGLRSNGLVGLASMEMSNRHLCQWVIMETVDDSSWLGFFKRLEYRRLFFLRYRRLQGVLAIGHRATDWFVARGLPKECVFPFSYFLPTQKNNIRPKVAGCCFRFIFVGNLIERKRLDFLINALSIFPLGSIELVVVGNGPMYETLQAQAELSCPGRVFWLGCLNMENVSTEIAKADCLVLPSRHDGWGVVASEALMVGTPVICSDSCGVAGVVAASGCGGVFRSGNLDDLRVKLKQVITEGNISIEAREKLAQWAYCLNANRGAEYLLEILRYLRLGGVKPSAPWETVRDKCA